MSQSAPNSDFTADTQTKKYVTPFAFKVHESLLGQRLASPRRRVAAITLDILVVSMLTTLSSVWLALMVLAICANAYLNIRNEPNKKWAKTSLFAAAGIAMVVLLVQLFLFDRVAEADQKVDSAKTAEVIHKENVETEFEGKDYSIDIVDPNIEGASSCGVADKCDRGFLVAVLRDMSNEGMTSSEIARSFDELTDFLEVNDSLVEGLGDVQASQLAYQLLSDNGEKGSGSFGVNVLDWIEEAVSELGRSFGWAAVYFSALTAWWNGQTVGKKLFGIRVVRIDGKNIDLWESMGRYGGYSAGIATGLLGFFQIYWGGNRQTIQDKISETLVVQP